MMTSSTQNQPLPLPRVKLVDQIARVKIGLNLQTLVALTPYKMSQPKC